MSFIEKFNRHAQNAQHHVIRHISNTAKSALEEGDLAPFFLFNSNNWVTTPINGLDTNNNVKLSDIYEKPLLVFFYSGEWKGYATELLNQINKARRETNTNILIVSPDSLTSLQHLEITFGVDIYSYQDKQNQLAEKFGIWSEDEPIWNKISGINRNVPLLSAFVVDQQGQIGFSYIERFEDELGIRDLQTALSA